MELIAVLGQIAWGVFVAAIVGMGFTIIVAVVVVPRQPLAKGVIVNVTVI